MPREQQQDDLEDPKNVADDPERAAGEEDTAPGEGDDKAPQSSEEAVKLASLMGWKPKAEWRGDPTNWRSAEDFLGEVPNVLKHTREAKAATDRKLNRVVAEVAKLTDAQRRQMGAQQEQRLTEYVEAGDLDGAKAVLAEARAAASPASDIPALAEFKERNAAWLGVDAEATDYMDSVDRRLTREAGGTEKITDPEAHLRRVEAAVKKRFPEHFGDARSPADAAERKAPLVGRGSRAERPSDNKLTVATLTSQQREAIAKMPGCKPESFVKSWNALREQGAI